MLLEYRNREEALVGLKSVLSRLLLLLSGDYSAFSALHYLRQAWPLYDGTRNDPRTDEEHRRVLLWYEDALSHFAKELGPEILRAVDDLDIISPALKGLGKEDLRFTAEALQDEMI